MLSLQLHLLLAGTSSRHSGEHPWGKLDTFYSCMLDVVRTDLFSQFDISMH